MIPSNGNNGFWKFIAVTCLGTFLGWGAAMISVPKDIVQERELTEQVLILNQKLDTQSNEISALRSTVNQESMDIAAIASKVGVTAHPVIAPR